MRIWLRLVPWVLLLGLIGPATIFYNSVRDARPADRVADDRPPAEGDAA